MNDVARLFQAVGAPAIFFSATALLILSINVRLMGIVSRLRQYVRAKHDAAKNSRSSEAEASTRQIASIQQRAEMIRREFLFALLALAGTLVSCLLLGFGLYSKFAAISAGGCVRTLDGLAIGLRRLLYSRRKARAQFGRRRGARSQLYRCRPCVMAMSNAGSIIRRSRLRCRALNVRSRVPASVEPHKQLIAFGIIAISLGLWWASIAAGCDWRIRSETLLPQTSHS